MEFNDEHSIKRVLLGVSGASLVALCIGAGLFVVKSQMGPAVLTESTQETAPAQWQSLPVNPAVPSELASLESANNTAAPDQTAPAQKPPAPAVDLQFANAKPTVIAPDFPFKAPNRYNPDSRINRFTLARDLEKLEPKGLIQERVRLGPGASMRIFWFNEFLQSDGGTFYHSWFYNQRLMSRVEIKVGSQQWRASSFQTLSYREQGPWRVVTTDENGVVMAEQRFDLVLSL